MKIEIPKEINQCIKKIQSNGFEAYIVGGCVRDSLLNAKPKDWDITTNALPHDIKKIFDHTYDTGIKHGTITVLINKTSIEVTTFRIESDYKDFRRPSKVYFTDSVIEDLARRDFTINAIAYNDMRGLIDPFGGMDDLKKRIIRGVGNASERFNEDALRMMRALRFSAQLSFDIECETKNAIEKNAALIKHISAERISDELIKLLMTDSPQKVAELGSIMKYILPEIDSIDNRILLELKASKKIAALRIFILLQSIEGDDLNSVLKRLRLDNKTHSQITALSMRKNEHINDNCPNLQSYKIKKLLSVMQDEKFNLLLDFWEAQELDNAPKIQRLRDLYNTISTSGECIYLKDLSVNGNDLKMLGVEPRDIGNKLLHLLDIVHRTPSCNSRLDLLGYIDS